MGGHSWLFIIILISGNRNAVQKKKETELGSFESGSTSSASSISTSAIQALVEQLKTQRYMSSTKKNYYAIWKLFNQFFLKLDVKPNSWEDRLTLFVAYLIESNKKSTTIKCDISAIKGVLQDVNVALNEDKLLLSSMTSACRIHKDTINNKLPIKKGLLSLLIHLLEEFFVDNPQIYLTKLYSTMFCTAYYGMFRIGEIAASQHIIKAKDVHVRMNKNKLMFVLHTSKTHNRSNKHKSLKLLVTP